MVRLSKGYVLAGEIISLNKFILPKVKFTGIPETPRLQKYITLQQVRKMPASTQ